MPFEPPLLPPDAPPQLREFWQLWRAGQFFECHEVLEELWRETHGVKRLFFNGLIHCAVAIYQHRRGNAVGAARQLVRAQEKLASFRPRFDGVEVDELLHHVEREIAPSLASLNPSQRGDLDDLKRSLRGRFTRFTEEDS